MRRLEVGASRRANPRLLFQVRQVEISFFQMRQPEVSSFQMRLMEIGRSRCAWVNSRLNTAPRKSKRQSAARSRLRSSHPSPPDYGKNGGNIRWRQFPKFLFVAAALEIFGAPLRLASFLPQEVGCSATRCSIGSNCSWISF